MPVKELPMHL